MNIALSLIVKNEQRSIRRCLESAASFVDQIIIVDTGSTDKTKNIIGEIRHEFSNQQGTAADRSASSLPEIHLFDFEWIGDFSAARNFALTKSEELGADVHFVLDADEYVISGSYESLHRFAENMTEKYGSDWAAMFIRNDYYPEDNASVLRCSKELCERIFPKGTRYSGIIHEQPTRRAVCVQAPIIADHDGYLFDGPGKGKRNLEYLKKALEYAPNDPYLHYQVAITLRNLKNLEESIPYFERFLAEACPFLYSNAESDVANTGAADNSCTHPNTNCTETGFFSAPECRNSSETDFSLSAPSDTSKISDPDTDDTTLPVYVSDGILRYLYTLLDLKTPDTLETANRLIHAVSDYYADSSDFYFFCGNFYTAYILQDIEHRSDALPLIEQCYQACLAIGERPDRAGVAGTGSFLAAYNLGVWYELNGKTEKAREYYSLAAKDGYPEAVQRLAKM